MESSKHQSATSAFGFLPQISVPRLPRPSFLRAKSAPRPTSLSSNPSAVMSAVPSRQDEQEQDLPEIFDAVIVGAGWAGLAAAKTLQQSDITNFCILEGRDYIGGRSITSYEFGPNNAIDLGSSWIHGKCRRNPIQALVEEYGLPYAEVGESVAAWDTNGSSGGDDESSGSWIDQDKKKRMERLRDGFMKYMRRRQISKGNDADVTLEQILQDYLKWRKIRPGREDDTSLRFMLEADIVYEYAAPLSELSLKYWDVDDELPGGDSYLAVGGGSGGYSAVVEKYADSVRSTIRLQTKVTAVDYSHGQHVTVHCVDAVSGQEQCPIVAKHCIVTLPLGVLQSGSVRFTPELPAAKKAAIKNLGNGLMNKVALYWEDMDEPDIFWPKDKEWILTLAPPESAGILEFYNPYKLDSDQRNLVGFVVGEQARKMEKMTDDEISKVALKSLRRIFGKDNVPSPTKTLISRWDADEFSCGSYSFQRIGSNKHSRPDLAKPVSNCLWFAGEATDRKFPSTAHGALMSGEKAGQGVIAELSKS